MTRARDGSSASSASRVGVVVAAMGVVAICLAAWWLLRDGTPDDALPTAPLERSGETAPPDDVSPLRAPPTAEPRAPRVEPPPILDALAGRLEWPAALDHFAAAAERLAAADDAEAFALRDGGRRLGATLPDGTEVVATHTASSDAAPPRERIPRTLPWDEALERLPEPNVDRTALDTVTLSITRPLPDALPAPWRDARVGIGERLVVTRSDGALTGEAHVALTPVPSDALVDALLARDPPGRARTGVRFEWSTADSVRARPLHAVVETTGPGAPTLTVSAPNRTTLPTPQAPDALAALVTRLEALLADDDG